MLTVGYLRGLFDIQYRAAQANIEVDFLVTEGEANISRGRDNMVATFLASDYDTLAFIDADIEMQGADFVRLARMQGVRGAAVCMKGPPGEELLSCWVAGERVKRAAMGPQSFAVDFLGAAVMFIDRTAFVALIESGAVSAYSDGGLGPGHAFFPSVPVDSNYLTEDYNFCKLCSDNGIRIMCHPGIQVKHYGPAYWQA
jgi:hypothetical protein